MRRLILAGLMTVASPLPAAPPSTGPAPTAAWPTTMPTSVDLSIDADDATAAARQLGVRLGTAARFSGEIGPVRAMATTRPFAAALPEFLSATGLTFDPDRSGVVLMRGAPLRVFPINDTATLLITQSAASMQQTNIAAESSERVSFGYTVQGVLVLDPALRVIAVSPAAWVDDVRPADLKRGVGANGRTYFDGGPPQGEGSPFGQFSLHFRSQRAVGKIESLKARVRTWQIVEEAAVDLPFASVREEQSVVSVGPGPGLTAAAMITQTENGRPMLRIRMSGPAVDMYRAPRWADTLRESVKAYDAAGQLLPTQPWRLDPVNQFLELTLRPDEVDSSGRTPASAPVFPQAAGVTFFDRLDRVSVRIPTKIKPVDLPIELRDIALPSR